MVRKSVAISRRIRCGVRRKDQGVGGMREVSVVPAIASSCFQT